MSFIVANWPVGMAASVDNLDTIASSVEPDPVPPVDPEAPLPEEGNPNPLTGPAEQLLDISSRLRY